mgnify:CR=1 FL=1
MLQLKNAVTTDVKTTVTIFLIAMLLLWNSLLNTICIYAYYQKQKNKNKKLNKQKEKIHAYIYMYIHL